MIPEPQHYLSDEAIQIYQEVGKLLEGVGALEEIDSYGLSMLADSLCQFKRAAQVVNERGPVQVYKTDAEGVSAWFTVKKDAYTMFLKYSEKYGLSPKDRQLILKFKAKKKQTDALDDL